jgi:hypothetical protein
MRPLTAMATFVLLVGAMPVLAQHGGGHASAGGHGGFASHGGGFAGHAGSGHPFSGTRTGSGIAAARPSAHGFASRPSLSSRGFNRSGGVRLRTRGFRNRRFGSGVYGSPWLYSGIYDPYWWWDSGSAFDYEQQYETGLANEMNQQSLEEQSVRRQVDQDFYARSATPPRRDNERAETSEAIVSATVLVFRDQHKQEVQNYAIVGQTLWNFAPQHTQKIPLSDLDLPATTKANDERGVDFRLPGAHEGQ